MKKYILLIIILLAVVFFVVIRLVERAIEADSTFSDVTSSVDTRF